MDRHSYHPAEGDILTRIISTDSDPLPLPYLVSRVNPTTGRGTVRNIESGQALQIVRRRSGHWILADGLRTPVMFLASWCQTAGGMAGVGHGQPRLGDLLDPVLADDQLPEDHDWVVTEVNDKSTQVVVRRLDDRSRVQCLYIDSAGCWRFEDGRRFWFVVPAGELRHRPRPLARITVTDRTVTNNPSLGRVITCTLRENGTMFGTMWKMGGRWSSAYDQDGEHSTRKALIEAMLSETGRRIRNRQRSRIGCHAPVEHLNDEHLSTEWETGV